MVDLTIICTGSGTYSHSAAVHINLCSSCRAVIWYFKKNLIFIEPRLHFNASTLISARVNIHNVCVPCWWMFTCAKCVLKLLLWYSMYFHTAPSSLSQTQCAAASVVRKTVTTTHFYAFMFMQENRWSLKCIIQLWTLASLSSSSGIMQTALLLVFCQGIRVCCSTMYYCSSHGKYWLFWRLCLRIFEQFIIIIYPLTARVVGAPQMILQTVFSIFPCSPLPSGTWRTPGLSIP